MIATSAADSFTLYIYPSIMVLATLIAALGGIPLYRRRQERERQRIDHQKRVAAASDAVLGMPADPNVGRPVAQLGLVDVVANIQKTVGHMNGTGMTLVDLGETAVTIAKETKEALRDHTASDDARFAALEKAQKGG